MTVAIYEVLVARDDVLVVRGAVDGVDVTGFGWQSALTNHYDVSAYGADGHRSADVSGRAMTPEEASAYAKALLIAAAPAPVPQAAPTTLPVIALDAEPPTPLQVAQASAGTPEAATTEGEAVQ